MKKNGCEIYRCPLCGLGETKLNVPYQRFVREFYSKGYFSGAASRSAYSNYARDKPYICRTMRTLLHRLQSLQPAGNGREQRARLLDVGCAYGYFIELALAAGYDAYGIDASFYAVSWAKRRYNGRVKQGTISGARFAESSFDVVTMLDVVEHLADPRSDLQKISALLADGGLLLIATGDTGSAAARVLGRRWTFYIPPQHLFFFNRDNLTRLLTQAGLEPISWFRVGKWLSLQYVFHLARTTGESKFAEKLYPLMERLPLGRVPVYLPILDNMVVIARKSS